ncbi:MAG: hypothetical protein J5641_01790 [Bacteroidales bacterium]|nr:hypothetical protein [Bacteroidales bacterium]
MKGKGILIGLMVGMLMASCGKEYMCQVPIGDATCQIDPNSTLYAGLNTCDGYEYLVGGYQGIVVVRTNWSEFAAYERTCPADSGRLEMAEGYGNIVLECPRCHSQFNTFGDGAPLSTSVTSCYLYQYSTHYDGQTLYISNY